MVSSGSLVIHLFLYCSSFGYIQLKMMLVDVINQIALLEFQVEEEQNFGPSLRRLFQEIQDLRNHRNKIQAARNDLLEFSSIQLVQVGP